MRIATIIPSNNCFNNTLATMHSAMRQSTKPDIVVIVDGDSPDGTFIKLCKLFGHDSPARMCEATFEGVHVIVALHEQAPIGALINAGGQICDPLADVFGILLPGTQYCHDAIANVSGTMDLYPAAVAVAGDHVVDHVRHGLTIASERDHYDPYDSTIISQNLPETMWVKRSALHTIQRFINPNAPSWHLDLYGAIALAGYIHHIPTVLTQSSMEVSTCTSV